jgi:hypothetical protein
MSTVSSLTSVWGITISVTGIRALSYAHGRLSTNVTVLGFGVGR